MTKKSTYKKAGATIASFGAALSAVYLSPAAVEADIVDLTPNLPASLPFGASTFIFDFVPGTASGSDMLQWNDSLGKSFSANGQAGDLVGFQYAPLSNIITTGQTFNTGIGVGTSQSGTATFGFLTKTNQVGWIKMNFGGVGGAITYLAAAFNSTPGGAIHAGTFAVPEPTGLAALAGLAMGAATLRRRRKQSSK